MIIARSESEIDRILDHFAKDGFEGPTVWIDHKLVDLHYWKDCMIENFKEKNLLVFDPKWEWDNQENEMKKYLRWYSPSTIDEYIED